MSVTIEDRPRPTAYESPVMPHNFSFLQLARVGKNDWWRYALTIILCLIALFVVGAVPVVLVALGAFPGTTINLETAAIVNPDNPIIPFVILNSSFFFWMAALLIGVVLFHNRPIRTLITPLQQISWRRVAQGAAVWLVLSIVLTAVEYALYPQRFELNINLARFIPFAIVALLVTPVQTTTEELFFRGYLQQWLGLKVKSPLVIALLSSALFAPLHGANPEVASGFWLLMGIYFTIGFLLAWVTIQDNRMELALGVHAINNLFGALIISLEGGALGDVPALVISNTLDPVLGLVGVVIASVVFYGVTRRMK